MTLEDAEEIPSTRRRDVNKIYNEFKTYPDLKAATESLRKLGWVKVPYVILKWKSEDITTART